MVTPPWRHSRTYADQPPACRLPDTQGWPPVAEHGFRRIHPKVFVEMYVCNLCATMGNNLPRTTQATLHARLLSPRHPNCQNGKEPTLSQKACNKNGTRSQIGGAIGAGHACALCGSMEACTLNETSTRDRRGRTHKMQAGALTNVPGIARRPSHASPSTRGFLLLLELLELLDVEERFLPLPALAKAWSTHAT